MDPQPYWGFDDLFAIARAKLLNCFYVQAETKKEGEREFFRYSRIRILQDFSFQGFLTTIESGGLFVDFDARTGSGRGGHNHGTKFRVRPGLLPELYKTITEID